MKTYFSVITTIIVLAASAWGQHYDMSHPEAKRFQQQEMNMMSGFLRTVLTTHFLDSGNQSQSDESTTENRFYRQGNRITNGRHWIDTSVSDVFYLQGQGVVFMIPVSALRGSSEYLTSFSTSGSTSGSTSSFTLGLSGVRLGAVYLVSGGEPAIGGESGLTRMSQVFSVPNTDGKPATLPDALAEAVGELLTATDVNTKISPEGRPGIDLIDITEQMANLQSQLREVVANQQAFLQVLDGVREPLVDTLAQYGDSMYGVNPEEYINLVFQVSPLASLNASGRGSEVISVRKSWITDYKAGKMTLEEFRKKVLQ